MPLSTRAAPAKNRTLSMDPGTSNSVLSLIGLPDWALSTRAYSSDRDSIRSARASSAMERSDRGHPRPGLEGPARCRHREVHVGDGGLPEGGND